MRSLFHILMATLLLLSTTGISTTRHYCGGFLMKVALGSHEDLQCCGMMDCCTNEIEHQQVEDDFQQIDSKHDLSAAYVFLYALPWAPAEYTAQFSTEEPLLNLRANAPPPDTAPPIYLRAEAFLC